MDGILKLLNQHAVSICRSLTECYECQPKPRQKTFPGCTIRNTPSEPIHCIVWAKHLFKLVCSGCVHACGSGSGWWQTGISLISQLFGEEDPDQDVSPDTEDPELTADAGKSALESEAKSGAIGGIERRSTRAWAEESDYNPEKLFNKVRSHASFASSGDFIYCEKDFLWAENFVMELSAVNLQIMSNAFLFLMWLYHTYVHTYINTTYINTTAEMQDV